MTVFYRVLQAIVIAVVAISLWFFFVGLGDGTIDYGNILLWMVVLAAPIAMLIISMRLWRSGQKPAAFVLLAVPAVPALLYGLYLV